jgi:hypothetical protein
VSWQINGADVELSTIPGFPTTNAGVIADMSRADVAGADVVADATVATSDTSISVADVELIIPGFPAADASVVAEISRADVAGADVVADASNDMSIIVADVE